MAPFDPLLAALASDQDAVFYAIGDSTDYGLIDADWFTKYGWPGRLCMLIGAQYDVNVSVRVFQRWSGNGTTSVGSATGPGTYASPVAIHSTAREGAPTLTVMLGGWPGGIASNYISYASAMLPTSGDVIVLYSGYNESKASTYATNMQSFITTAQSRCPGVPIVVCDQHKTTITRKSGGLPYFASLFNALLGVILPGATLPLAEPLQPSTALSGVWFFDTQQAAVDASGLNPDGLHPNSSGYDVLANYMFDIVSPDGRLIAPTITTETLDALTVGQSFTQVLAVTGTTPITWAVQSGALPAGLSLDPTSGAFSGTPTAAGPYDATVRATNSVDHDDKQFTGTVLDVVPQPFSPDTIGKPSVMLGGLLYSINPMVRIEGTVKPLALRD